MFRLSRYNQNTFFWPYKNTGSKCVSKVETCCKSSIFLGFVLNNPNTLFWPFKKCFKNQHFFNISAVLPHGARTYTHIPCLWKVKRTVGTLIWNPMQRQRPPILQMLIQIGSNLRKLALKLTKFAPVGTKTQPRCNASNARQWTPDRRHRP